MSESTKLGQRTPRFVRRLVRCHARHWAVTIRGTTVTLSHRRAAVTFHLNGLDREAREVLAVARNDTDIYQALPSDVRTAFTNALCSLVTGDRGRS